MITIKMSVKEAFDLSNTICRNFYSEQADRFETWDQNKSPDKIEGGSILWFDDKLSALLSYKVISAKEDACMIWDMAQNEWAVVCSIDYN